MKLSTLLATLETMNDPTTDIRRDNQSTLGSPSGDRLMDTDIGSIHYRAQEVLPGGMFVAIEGQTADGHDFVHQALERGAAAIIAQKEPPRPFLNSETGTVEPYNRLPAIIRVKNTRLALASLAARFFNYPSRHMTLVAVTGTNGKTTVSYLIENILLQAGFKVGVIGTINYRYGDKTVPNPMTTPESLDLQRILSEMQQAGVTHVVLEASSHAMELGRIKDCWFDVAAFTNLSQDHLDFHGDMQTYWASKKRLFTEYLAEGPKKHKAAAVINCDDPRGSELAETLSLPVIRTGLGAVNEIRSEYFNCNLIGTEGKVATHRGSFEFSTPLVGVHNVENILCAAGVATALKIAPETIKAGVEALTAIPGRLEPVSNTVDRFVYVDYAHTPDALKNAATALKKIAPARIICVFGCGGDRDRKKRPLMGEIVARLCDLAIVTSDNPRTEDPLAIIDQILPGVRKVQGHRYSAMDLKSGFDRKGYAVEPDRRRAIELGIMASRPQDAVLIAGKGHETYQILGTAVVAFDDREEARKVLQTMEAFD